MMIVISKIWKMSPRLIKITGRRFVRGAQTDLNRKLINQHLIDQEGYPNENKSI